MLLPILAGCSPALTPRPEVAPQARYGELQGNLENRLVAFNALPHLLPLDGEVKLSRRGGKLLVSNDPEYLRDSAILPAALYRDELAGSFRVFYHHANNTQADLTLAAAITNTQAAPLLLFTRGLGGHTNVYPDVAGQEALSGYLGMRHRATYLATLTPGESTLVALHTAGPGDTASALEEYVVVTPPSGAAKRAPSLTLVTALTTIPVSRNAAGAKQPNLPPGFSLAAVTVTVVAFQEMVPKEPHLLPVMPAGPPKPVEGTPYHLLNRGTFPFSDRYSQISLKPGSATVLTLNSAVSGPFSRALDGEYLLGTDAVSGRKGFNNGNYGVIYSLRLCISTDAPLGLSYGLLMQPAGGSGHYTLQAEGDIVRSPFVTHKNGWWFYQARAFGPKVCMSLRADLTGGSFGPQKFLFVPLPFFGSEGRDAPLNGCEAGVAEGEGKP